MKKAMIIALCLSTGCSAATRLEDEQEGCHFTYEDDSGREPYECVVHADSEETCLDAGSCICRASHPGGSEAEIEACMVDQIMPRAMITLSDYCAPTGPVSLTEALSSWADERGSVVVADGACDDMPATYDYP